MGEFELMKKRQFLTRVDCAAIIDTDRPNTLLMGGMNANG